jgi:hypothetical protein
MNEQSTQINNISFEEVTEDDVCAMTEIAKRAFDEDTFRHLGEPHGGPPGYDNGDYVRRWFLHKDACAYKILKDGELIGGISLIIDSDNKEGTLESLFIAPLCHDKGVGSFIWKFIEQKHSDVTKWKTETPGYSKRNHNFYINKCGFRLVKIDTQTYGEECYMLEKDVMGR